MPGTLQARLAIAAVAALVAWAAVATLARAQPAQVSALSTTGAVRLSSDHEGVATLVADHLVPGRSVSGTVRLTNTGDADGLVDLAQTGVTDVAGAGGGRLSQALRLRVEDVTSGAPVLLSDGPLGGLTQLPIGRLAAGASRVLRLTATLPDTGVPVSAFAGDNALQGASVRMDWAWTAISVDPLPPAPTPTPAPTATPPHNVPAAPLVLVLQQPRQRVLLHRQIRLRARCSIACTATLSATLQTAPYSWPWYRTLLRRKVIKPAKPVTLPAAGTRWVRLNLTKKALRAATAALRARGRVSVLVTARVQSASGPQVSSLRVVLTAKVPVSRGSAHRR